MTWVTMHKTRGKGRWIYETWDKKEDAIQYLFETMNNWWIAEIRPLRSARIHLRTRESRVVTFKVNRELWHRFLFEVGAGALSAYFGRWAVGKPGWTRLLREANSMDLDHVGSVRLSRWVAYLVDRRAEEYGLSRSEVLRIGVVYGLES